MDNKDLHKLKRSELLEIMLAQSEEIDRLRAEIAEKDKQLADRRIAIDNAGSLAEASLQLTRIFVEAQTAADIYVANVKANAHRDAGAASAASTAQSYTSKPVQPASPGNAQPQPYVAEDDDDDMPRGRHAHIPGRKRGPQNYGAGAR